MGVIPARGQLACRRDQLEGLLLENEGKPARERLTLIRIFEKLRALGRGDDVRVRC